MIFFLKGHIWLLYVEPDIVQGASSDRSDTNVQKMSWSIFSEGPFSFVWTNSLYTSSFLIREDLLLVHILLKNPFRQYV